MNRTLTLFSCASGWMLVALTGCGESSPAQTGSGGSSATSGGGGDRFEMAGSNSASGGSNGSSGGNAQGGSNDSGGGNVAGDASGSGGVGMSDASTTPDAKPVVPDGGGGSSKIKNVFIVLEENHN